MQISKALLEHLKEIGIKNIYGVPSGTINPILDKFNDIDINYIITKNEAAASFSACKYAKTTENLGVLLVGGAVGVGNSINGIAEAMQSKAPLLIITGAVAAKQRNLGMIQGIDSDKYVKNLVKYSKYIEDGKDVIAEIHKAIEIAMEYPRGPVHISIPLDVQKQEYEEEVFNYDIYNGTKIETDYNKLDEAIDLINRTENGLIMLGGGCRNLGEDLEKLINKLGWRFMTSVSSKGIIRGEHPLNLGNYGFAGTDLACDYIDNGKIECVIALGSSLGESSTKTFNPKLTENRKLIHINIDENDFNRAYKADISIAANLQKAVPYMLDNVIERSDKDYINEPLNKPYKPTGNEGISLQLLCEKITDILPANTYYVSDMGEFMNFVFKYLKLPKEADFECNLNYGCMGGSTGAMGISTINNDRLTAAFIGDGSFYMNGMAELLTQKKYNMNIIHFVINNSKLGYVDRGQTMLYGRSHEGFLDERIDIYKVTEAMGIPSIQISSIDELDKVQDLIKNTKNGPRVVEVINDISEPIPLDRFKTLNV